MRSDPASEEFAELLLLLLCRDISFRRLALRSADPGEKAIVEGVEVEV